MKLVVELPEEVYNAIKEDEEIDTIGTKCIREAIPLNEYLANTENDK